MNKFIKTTLFSVGLALATFSLFAIPAHAQTLEGLKLLKYDNLDDLLGGIITFLTTLAPVLAGLVLVYGGYLYFLGGFDQKANGLKAIQSAVIGLAIVLSYQVIKSLIQGSLTGDKFSSTALIAFIQSLFNPLQLLATVVAGLVIIYGGYQYFFGGFDQKSDGLKTIRSGVIGLAIVLSYQFITTLVTNTVSGGNFSTASLTTFLQNITTSLVGLSSIFAIAVIIYGGYRYMFSSLPGVKEDGKKAITNGVIGLIAIILAYPIIELIKSAITITSTGFTPNTGVVQTFIVTNIINGFLIPLSSIFTVFFFIIGGYYMLTSGGNDAQYKKGLGYIQNAIIGLIVVLVSFTATQLIIYFVNGLNIG
jgi:hypothetical protein